MTAGSRSAWKLRSGWICRHPTTITPPLFPLPTATPRSTNGWARLAYRRCSMGQTEPGPLFPAAIQTWYGYNKGRLGSKFGCLAASSWKLVPARQKRPGRTRSRLNERITMRIFRQPVPGLQRTERGPLMAKNSAPSSILQCVLFVVATASSGSVPDDPR